MKITINGQPYADWASIPPEYQSRLAASQPDTNGSGVPDALEGDGKANVTIDGDTVSVSGSRSTTSSTTTTDITLGGRSIKGWLSRLLGR